MKELIYCLGDSNTFGYDPRSFLGEPYMQPWPQILGRLLNRPIYNDGVNGRTVSHVLENMDLLIKNLSSLDPSLLVILLGSNDLLMDPLADPKVLGVRMEALIHRVRSERDTLPILLLSPPEIRIPGPFRDLNAQASEALEALAKDNGLDFLNLSRCALPISCDGVHLTEEGHNLLSRILYQHLK